MQEEGEREAVNGGKGMNYICSLLRGEEEEGWVWKCLLRYFSPHPASPLGVSTFLLFSSFFLLLQKAGLLSARPSSFSIAAEFGTKVQMGRIGWRRSLLPLFLSCGVKKHRVGEISARPPA